MRCYEHSSIFPYGNYSTTYCIPRESKKAPTFLVSLLFFETDNSAKLCETTASLPR